MSPLRFGRVETALGPMLLAATDRGLAASSTGTDLDGFLTELQRRFPDAEVQPATDGATWLEGIGAWIDGFLTGARRDLPSVDLSGVRPFDSRVFEAVRAIPYGATATYGEVAAVIGSPLAARAVGGAMARCPLFPAVPCHRVVRAADGFSGWGGPNLALKRRLLDLERAAR
jgi:AraC family transcriptional regulator of adaptative response/methylated-DNA-[protein]-cysteine methyltransferase